MAAQIISKIRDCIRSREYEMTRHAFDEMAEDELSLLDVEQSILSGKIFKTEIDDVRGRKYTIHGEGNSPFEKVSTVGRFFARWSLFNHNGLCNLKLEHNDVQFQM